jgi:hypothetical protein
MKSYLKSIASLRQHVVFRLKHDVTCYELRVIKKETIIL